MASTSFNTEEMEVTSQAQERVQNILHPGAGSAATAPSKATSEQRQRKPRSDAGKPRTAKPDPKPGTVILKIETTIPAATELLAYAMRTQQIELAHSIVDAIAKAQKASE